MWRPFTIIRRFVVPSIKDNVNISKLFFSSTSRLPKSTAKLTLVSASIGVLLGAGYGGYTHYKVNKKHATLDEKEEFAFLKNAPDYIPQYRVVRDTDSRGLHLVLFQYRTCPFCCKVRAYLDSKGVSYEVVEVDAVLRQAIKWSGYKKVPIVLAKVDGGYQQLLDSSAIVSILETYLQDRSSELLDVIKFYPATKYTNESGKSTTEIANKYFIMHNSPLEDEKTKQEELDVRKWRQWADNVLVHTLSPNVYRTAAESLETFKWFEQAGRWKETFPTWECALMVYVGASAMWIIAKKLKSRHNIKDDVRQSLYEAANEWMTAVKNKGTPFLGGYKPNLADITVYGVLSSIEGCQAFQDMRKHTDIGTWYDEIKLKIERKADKVTMAHV